MFQLCSLQFIGSSVLGIESYKIDSNKHEPRAKIKNDGWFVIMNPKKYILLKLKVTVLEKKIKIYNTR